MAKTTEIDLFTGGQGSPTTPTQAQCIELTHSGGPTDALASPSTSARSGIRAPELDADRRWNRLMSGFRQGQLESARSRVAGRRAVIASWGVLAISVAAYTIVGLVLHQPFREGARALNYFDLHVYHGAAQRLARGQDLYDASIWKGLGFTYPPFAALVLLPLAAAPFGVDHVAVTAINLVLLVWMLRRALLIPSAPNSERPRPVTAWSIAALAAGAAIWLEPVSVTLGYGQINLLIAALVVLDLSLPDHHRAKGIAIGVAAAIKLTPLLFIAYLLLAGRRRVAARATAVFAASIALTYMALPRDASAYWGHGLFLNSSRVGNAADVANQSLHGALARLSDTAQLTANGYLLIGVVVLAGLALAATAARRGDPAAGYSLTALSTLLASPISWTHHWTLIVPALLLLARRAHQRHSLKLWAATCALLALGYAYAPEQLSQVNRPLHPGPLTILTADPYALAAILALAATAAATAHTYATRRTMSSAPPNASQRSSANRRIEAPSATRTSDAISASVAD
jgi:alpha-1,2-mannosyltransferase